MRCHLFFLLGRQLPLVPSETLARVDQAVDKRKDNALFVEIANSQKAFAARAVKWDLDTNVSRRMAYNHYFGAKQPAKKA